MTTATGADLMGHASEMAQAETSAAAAGALAPGALAPGALAHGTREPAAPESLVDYAGFAYTDSATPYTGDLYSDAGHLGAPLAAARASDSTTESAQAEPAQATAPAPADAMPTAAKAMRAPAKATAASAKAMRKPAKATPAPAKAMRTAARATPAPAKAMRTAAKAAPTAEPEPKPAAAPASAKAAPASAKAAPAPAKAAPAPAKAAPAAEAAPSLAAAGWRAPGLDGVRALAVLAVLAFHEGLSWIPGGFLGVDVFFVLSGYLITDLLVTRFRKDGRVGLSSFWQRRARRLLPALAALLVSVTAAVVMLEPSQRAALRPALLGAVTYTSNWWQALSRVSYFQRTGPPPPFEHLWSLAVEEQFYLLWPLILAVVLLLVRRPAARALVAWSGALASAIAMAVIYTPGKDPSLVYYGTDTHASALMVGAALALTWPLAKVAAASAPMRLRLDLIGGAGLVLLCWAAWHFSGANSALYPYGLVLAAIAAGGLVLAAAAPGLIGTMLSWQPLRWLGIRSYGIYLWHWPVIAITAGIAVRSDASLTAHVVEALAPIGLAAVSWRWLEEPILRNGLRAELARRARNLPPAFRAPWRAPATAAGPLVGAVAVIAGVAVAGYGILVPQTGPTIEQQIAHGAQISAITEEPAQGALPSSQPDPWWIRAGRGPYRVAAHLPKPVRVPGYKVMAIGDSVMLASAPELAQALPGIYIDAKVSRAMIAGIAIIRQFASAKRLRRVVIVGLGTNGPISLDQIRQIRAAIGARWLILINTFVPRPWEREVNSALAAAAARYPNVLLVNWHQAIEHHTNLLWSDGIHPQPVGGRLYARVVREVVMKALDSTFTLRRPGPRPRPFGGFLLHASDARL